MTTLSLETRIKALTADRDEYRLFADAMAAGHKVERDALLLANRDLSDWFDALKADHDKLLAAGKLALDALETTLTCSAACCCSGQIAIAALKEAGVR